MKKILLLLDAESYKAEILDFATAVGKPDNSVIVGIFVEHHHLAAVPSVRALAGQVYVEEIVEDVTEQKNKNKRVQDNIELFKNGCIQRELKALVHHDKGIALENMIGESRYADLLIVDPATTFNGDRKVPSKFVMELLAAAECPVLIAPEYFEEVNEVVFAYDGSKSSAYAIKQFQYQLPHLAHRKITVLHVSEHGHTSKSYKKEQGLFKEWLQFNFSNISFLELEGEPRDILFEYFMEQEQRYNKMLVTGAFGRNLLSSFFKPSTADLVLKAIDIPIFVSHVSRS